MKITTTEQKAEAIRRMGQLNIFPDIIREFERNNLVAISEEPFGAFYWANEQEQKIIDALEKKYHMLVYLIIRSHSTIGLMDSILFISKNPEEWSWEQIDIENNILFAYVQNYDSPDCSEFGSIGFRKTAAGGLIRTA